MPTLRSEFACPLCERQTGKIVQIMAAEGRLICPERSDHRWVDTPSFFNDRPRMAFKPTLVKAVQTDVGPIKITVKNHLIAASQTKFGDKLDATVEQILAAIVEGDHMIITESDMKRLTDRLGQRPANSSELIGLIYAKMCEVDEAKEERDRAVKDLKAYESMAPGRVVVDLGQQFDAAMAKARDAELPLKLYIEGKVRTAIEENWF